MFEVKQLNKSVKDKSILNNVSFAVKRGQIAVFLGGSGVGKTTLLRVLNNLETCQSGSFFLDSKPLNLLTVNRNHTVGMVFQHFNLFDHLTVENNITLSLIKLKGKSKTEAKAAAHLLLEKYGLLEKASSPVQKLSGGQKQRLAIARALALNPEIICLDEPSSALDPVLTSQLAKYIVELAAEGRIVLLTTHDMSLLQQFESTLFLMQQGSIVESGQASECFKKSPCYPLLSSFVTGG